VTPETDNVFITYSIVKNHAKTWEIIYTRQNDYAGMCMCHFYGVDNHYCFSCQKPIPRSVPRNAPQFLKVCLALCLAARPEVRPAVRLEVRLKVRFALRFALRPRTNKPSLCDPLIVFTK